MTRNPSRFAESRLSSRIASGDREAFATFLDSYGPSVHRLTRRYAASESDAEDLVQETFLDLYKSMAGFRGDAGLATWVYRITLNHCLRYREKTQRRGNEATESFDVEKHECADLGADPTGPAMQRELSIQVQVALDALSALHRDVVILHELHGLTYAQCAGVLDIPIGTVKSRLSNAFKALRDSLGTYVVGEVDQPTASYTSSHPEVAGESL